MGSVLKISLFFPLVFAIIVSANERGKRSGLIDLGTSVLLPWGLPNNGGRNKVFSSENSRGRNNNNQNLNGRNELLQRQGGLPNAYNNKKQNQAQGAVDSNLIQDSLKQYFNNRNIQGELQQQRDYSSLRAYSFSDSGPSVDEALNGRIGLRQSLNSDQTRNQVGNNQFSQQNLGVVEPQSNTQSNEIISVRGQLDRNNNEALIESNRLNRYRQLSGFGVGLSRANVQQKNSLGDTLPQAGFVLNQENLRNQGQAKGVKEYLVRENQEGAEQVNIQQDNQEVNDRDNSGRSYQSLGSIDNQQLNRPVAQEIISGVNSGQYPLNAAWRSQRQPVEFDDSGLRTNSELVQLQSQEDLNQQDRNSYTYGELSAKIWNVIKSDPSMMSNLGNLREQLLNTNNPGNKQIGQLKSLLQDARIIPRNNVGQSLEQRGRNAFIHNLIDAVNKNSVLSNPLNARGQNFYRGRKA